MTALLSANGDVVTVSSDPVTEVLVATAGGLVRLERAGPGASWAVSDWTLEGTHPACLVRIPGTDRLLCGLHYDGGLMISDDDGRTWGPSNDGFASPHIYCLAVQQRHGGEVVYAGTEPPMLYESTDAGVSWDQIESIWDVPDTDQWRFPPPPHIAHVKNVAFHPDRPDTLFVCVEQGDVLKSDDAGRTWRSLTAYEKPTDQFRRDMHRVLIRPSNPDAVYLASGVGLYLSEDGGETWDHLTPGDHRVGYPDCLFFDPRDERTLYMAGASRAPNPSWRGTGSANPAVLRTRDGGRSWQELGAGLPAPVGGNIEAMAAHQSDTQLTLFAGTSAGELWGSDDGGESWSLFAGGLNPVSKGAHYRHFVTPEERERIESGLKRQVA